MADSREFVDFSEEMIFALGDVVEPYRKGIYNSVRNNLVSSYPNFNNEEMTPHQEVADYVFNGGKDVK